MQQSYHLAHTLLDKYGGEVDDFFKLWPPDKYYFYSSDKKAFIAYGISLKVAICTGDPVGAAKSINLVVKEFRQFAKEKHLTIAFIQTTDKYAKTYKANDLNSILIGADAVIDLKKFNDQTISNKYFRNLVNRLNKNGYIVTEHLPPHSDKLIKELEKVSSSWTNLPHRKEWSFLTGRFDKDYLDPLSLYVLRDKHGHALAFVNELPIYKPGVSTVDLMRRSFDSPPNSIDLLFIELLRRKYTEGQTSFNLGMSPLDGKEYAEDRMSKFVLMLYGKSENIIGFKGLHQFKSKYGPNWEPRYAWYSGSPARLVQIGVAVSQLMKAS